MRDVGLTVISPFFLLCGIVLVNLGCLAQQTDNSQSCDGIVPPAARQKDRRTAGKTGSAVTAVAIPGEHSIQLSWTESTTPVSAVAGYYIYRRENGPKCQVEPNECETLNSKRPIKGGGCTDYSVVTGHSYIYQARTVGKNGLTSTFSNDAPATAR